MNNLQNIKKISKKYIFLSINYLLIIVMLGGFLVPKRFQYIYQEDDSVLYPVYASQEQGFDGIRLDTLMPGEDGETKIRYTVKKGDTIKSVSQQFGTTIQSISNANNLPVTAFLNVGDNLIIGYEEGVLITIGKKILLQDFAKQYNLNSNDLVAMNYLDNDLATLSEGQEVFVNLNQAEAIQRGLLEKKPFVSPFEKFKQEDEEQKLLDQEGNDAIFISATDEIPTQEIITAEETAEQLARVYQKTEEEVKEIQPQEEKEIQQNTVIQCSVFACVQKGSCVEKPANAYCLKDTEKKARKCKQGYQERNNQCVSVYKKEDTSKVKEEKKKSQEVKKEKKSSKAVTKGYFNPRSDGAPSDGWGPGQCTSFAHWYWWKYYGIKSMGFRGNGGQWGVNASRAGWKVNKSPSVGAIAVMGGGGGYGHVAVVIATDNNSVRIREMNYAGRYIVTERRVSVTSIRSFIHPKK